MSTKMGFWRWALASAAILIATGTAGARVIDPTGVTTNQPTAILLYPQLKVDLNTCQAGFCSLLPSLACASNADCQPTCGIGGTCNTDSSIACTVDADCPGAAVDTLVQLTNTSEFLTRVHCLYTNTNGHCSNSPTTICTDENFRSVCPLGGACIPGWVETNFSLTLTKRQPVSWSVDEGLSELPLANIGGQGVPPQFNDGSIPVAPEVPFTGELFCVQVDTTTGLPTDRNDLKGEASIVKTVLGQIDGRKYNAIGIKAIEGRQDANPTVLNVGGPDAEYGIFNETVDPPRFAGCPNILTLNHFFDGANVVTHDEAISGPVRSDLTIVPCERDYINQALNLASATVQFLIFNEFEQRFSTSTRVECYKEVQLSDIDTRPGPEGDAFSIFAVGVQGTLTGLSRLRSVAGPNVDGYDARTILAVLTENWGAGNCGFGGTAPASTNSPGIQPATLCATDADCPVGATCEPPQTKTTAANIQFQGSREQGDRILVPLP